MQRRLRKLRRSVMSCPILSIVMVFLYLPAGRKRLALTQCGQTLLP